MSFDLASLLMDAMNVIGRMIYFQGGNQSITIQPLPLV